MGLPSSLTMTAEFANAFMDKWDDATPNVTTWSDFKKSVLVIAFLNAKPW